MREKEGTNKRQTNAKTQMAFQKREKQKKSSLCMSDTLIRTSV